MKIALDTTDCVFFQLAKANQVALRYLTSAGLKVFASCRATTMRVGGR
jgi:hypothetical protein